jgi:hypothetical protein
MLLSNLEKRIGGFVYEEIKEEEIRLEEASCQKENEYINS